MIQLDRYSRYYAGKDMIHHIICVMTNRDEETRIDGIDNVTPQMRINRKRFELNDFRFSVILCRLTAINAQQFLENSEPVA